MQAVFLLYDYRLYPNVDTLLRAFGIAQLAANAVVRHKVTCFPCLCPAEGEAGAFKRLPGKVKPFSRPLVYFEYGEGTAGAHIGISFFHIRILSQQAGKLLRPCFFRLSMYRYRPAGQGIFARHSG